MKTKGYAAITPKAPLVPFEFERRELGEHDVCLDIKYAGICHSDIHQAREEWGKAIFPMVPGHEIAGVVTAIGAKVSKFVVGQKIGVGVFVDSCRKCEQCQNGMQQYCAEGMTVTYNAIARDGKTSNMGGYSQHFIVTEDYAVSIPDGLPLEGVAPLLCAGITLYSPIRHWGVKPGQKVGVIGLGGLGHMGVKFAAALGAEVTVFSHSPQKRSDALAMGAKYFVNTSEKDSLSELRKSFDLILNTVSAEIDVNPFLELLKIDGALVLVGLPPKPLTVHAGTIIGARRSLSGSTIGGIPELQEMLNFCGEKSIVSDVEVIDADYINTAYERTVASDVKYRFVIDASTF